MKVIVAGSRAITDFSTVARAIRDSGFVVDEVVCGQAEGVDANGERWATERRVPVAYFPANWAKYGNSAGPIPQCCHGKTCGCTGVGLGRQVQRVGFDEVQYATAVQANLRGGDQMTPVNQSKLYQPDGIHNGNCLAACLASLLDIPLWMVPSFDQMFGRDDWRERIDQWMKRMFQLRRVRTEGHDPEALPEYYIANGPGGRGVHHSVIYQRAHIRDVGYCGVLAHDPHPAKTGLVSVEWTWHLEPL